MDPKFKYYVYQLRNPIISVPFYIGKGSGNRWQDHFRLSSKDNSLKTRYIRALREIGIEPVCDILFSNLSESLAYDLEKELIRFHGRLELDINGILTNNRIDCRPIMTTTVRENISKTKKDIPFTENHKTALSNARAGKSWKDLYGDKYEARLSKAKSPKGPMKQSRKDNISKAKKGIQPHNWTQESRDKLSLTNSGRTPSENTLKQVKINAKIMKTCPHCNTMGNGPAMQRWHFNHCKKAIHAHN